MASINQPFLDRDKDDESNDDFKLGSQENEEEEGAFMFCLNCSISGLKVGLVLFFIMSYWVWTSN